MKICGVKARPNLRGSIGPSLRVHKNFRTIAFNFVTKYRHVPEECTNGIFDMDLAIPAFLSRSNVRLQLARILIVYYATVWHFKRSTSLPEKLFENGATARIHSNCIRR